MFFDICTERGNRWVWSTVDRVIRKVTCVTFAFGIFRILKKKMVLGIRSG